MKLFILFTAIALPITALVFAGVGHHLHDGFTVYLMLLWAWVGGMCAGFFMFDSD